MDGPMSQVAAAPSNDYLLLVDVFVPDPYFALAHDLDR